MIDYFALALTHVLIAVALLRILSRSELDREDLSAQAEVAGPAKPGRSQREARRQRARAEARDA